MSKRLELIWPNKDKVLLGLKKDGKPVWGTKADVEPRILVQLEGIGTINHDNVADPFLQGDNLLIKGDNLLALKALERRFSEKIKCIYVDPPFNTGNAFEHYDDGLEHTIWLSMMKARLEILKNLLSKNGVIFVHIDNNEVGHLRVLMDEVFSRHNFVQMISEKRASPAGFKTINPGPLTVTDYILMYSRNKDFFKWKPSYVPVDYDENYDMVITNPQDEPEKWKFEKIHDIIYKREGFTSWRDAKTKWGTYWKVIRKSLCGTFALANAARVVSIRDPHKPSKTIRGLLEKSKAERDRVFVLKREKYVNIYILNGGALSFYKNKLREIDGELVPTEILTDLWDDINYAGIAEEGGVQFKNSKKPEMLLKRIIEMSTKPGEWVLDSFLGSGTTAAVAHKLGRKWIGIELGKHAETHCLPRLKRVVTGEDQTGISKQIAWKGGGGFRYCVLGESFFAKDKDTGIIMINSKYKNGLLVNSVCNLENFELNNDSVFHGIRGNTYAHVTEERLTQTYIDALVERLPDGKSLVVYYLKRTTVLQVPERMKIKRIPKELQIPRYLTNGGERMIQ
jgi:adenine-specific DNA-methyltransferase